MKKHQNVEDAKVIGFSDALFTKAASVADRLTQNKRGFLAVEGLIAAGYVRDASAARRAYAANPGAIEALFNQVDVKKLVETFAAEPAKEALQNGVVPFAAGAVLGAGVTLLATKKRK